jgi:alpha-ketoglutarate-dependent taurine dioxygenase
VPGVALGSISDTGFDQIYDLWLEHALLVFPAQHLTKDEQKVGRRAFRHC